MEGTNLNRAFFRAMFKQHRHKLVKFSSGIVLYEVLLTWVYPAITENPAVLDVVDALPSTVKTVFGVSSEARADTFEAYISGQFLTRIWTFLMAFYGISTANALLSKLIDDGSLVLPLSAPISRKEILTSQTAVLLSSNVILIGLMLLGLFSAAAWFGIELDHVQYLELGALALAFFSVIGSYSFLFSVWFGNAEQALAYAYGLTFAFYVLDVIGNLSKKLTCLKRLSIFNLFKPQEVLEGSANSFGSILGLTATAFFLSFVANHVFEAKDLAL